VQGQTSFIAQVAKEEYTDDHRGKANYKAAQGSN